MTELQFGNAIIKIYRPTLTAEEQKKRERNVLIALQQVGQSMEGKRHEKQN